MNDPHDHPNDGAARLSPLDAAALDARFGAKGPVPDAARVERLAGLLALLDAPAPARSPEAAGALVDVTLARVLRAGERVSGAGATGTGEDALTPDDDEALDALVGAGFEVSRVPGSLRARAAKVDAMRALVADSPAGFGGGALLVERTLSRIPVRRREPERSWGVGTTFRLADLVSLAAVLAIAASVVWPVMSTVRAGQRRDGCGTNVASLAGALGSYAADYRDALPMAAASLAGPTWWDVGAGPGRSNSANLYQLPKLRYAPLAVLACPGNAKAPCGPCDPSTNDWGCIEEVSYSYRVNFGAPARWNDPATIALGDASPVTRRARAGQRVFADQNSGNHAGRGQWVLRGDGAGVWLATPEYDGDNIWLPALYEVALKKAAQAVARGATQGEVTIRGDELPDSTRDAFLGP